jgi:predicted CoA-substrate-specific enzyme activase
MMRNFVMNDKCAAGTGRFLDVMSHVLGCGLEELPELSEKADKNLRISNTCTVFAESEVISQLAAGETRENIAKGILVSIAERIVGLTRRINVVGEVVMTGGSAANRSLVSCISESLQSPIVVPETPQLAGALGAAIFARDMYGKRVKQVAQKQEREEKNEFDEH